MRARAVAGVVATRAAVAAYVVAPGDAEGTTDDALLASQASATRGGGAGAGGGAGGVAGPRERRARRLPRLRDTRAR